MNNKTMGDRIKFHRKRLGLTQEQLAERLGVSAQAVSKWENNLSCPDISILPELASIFGISVDALLGRPAQAQPVHEAQPVSEDDEPGWKLEKKLNFCGIGFALYVLSVGGLLLAGALIPAMEISWWTVVWTTGLVYIGLSGLVGGFSVFSLGMTCGGLFFLLEAYDLIHLQLSWSIVLPALLLIWGVSLLLDVLLGKNRRKKKRSKSTRKLHHEYTCNNGELHCEMSFGEYRAAVVTPLLRGGSIDSSFGDFTVDFSACEALVPDCTLEVSNSFGQLTLLVPEKFSVVLEPKSTFAAAPEIKGCPAETVEGTLNLRTSLSFGAMEIRYI